MIEDVDRSIGIKQFYTRVGGKIQVNPHPKQAQVFRSVANIIAVLAGTQSGKTLSGPVWLWKEIQKWDKLVQAGGGAHGAVFWAVSPSYPLMEGKLWPEYKHFFVDLLGIATANSTKRTLAITLTRDNDEKVEYELILKSADKADSLASSTVAAMHIDEAGMDSFSRESWVEAKARLGTTNGRILITTCYDDQTEIYTDTGWKLLGELTDDDKVYAPNENGVGVFEYPHRRTWEHYDGKMLKFKGGRIDLCVTPNHRILYKNSTRFYIKDAAHFSKLKHRSLPIPKIIHPVMDVVETFTLPAASIGHRWGTTYKDEVVIPMNDWCAFMGWFLTEGSVTGSNGGSTHNGKYLVSCSQNFDGDDWHTMKNDMDKLPFKWHRDGNSYVTSNKQLWEYIRQFGNCYNKFIPRELMHAGTENLLTLIDRMVIGDGSVMKRGSKGEYFVYYTTSPQLAADFREVCMLAGMSTGMKKHDSQPFPGTNGSFKPIYHIWQRKRQSGIVKDWKEIDYDGMIGCVGTSTGLVLVRRNGEECISGNTLYNFGWLKTQVYDLWKADPIGSDIEVIRFESIDNPLYSRKEWDYAKKTMPTYLFNMRHRGIYDKPGGMVYDCLDEDIHYVKPFLLPDGCEKHVGIDPGMVNHSTVWIAELTPADDVYNTFTHADGVNSIYVAYKASLYGSTTTTMTNTEHAKIALADPDYPFVTSWCGGARAEKYFREDYKAVGINVVEPPFTEVEAGISKVYELIKLNRLYFTKDLKEIVSGEFSLQSYSRKMDANGEPTAEIHQKARYHYADAIRYAIAGIGTQSKSSCNIASIQGSALY